MNRIQSKKLLVPSSAFFGITLFIIAPLYSLPLLFKGMYNLEKWAFTMWAFFMGIVGLYYPPSGDVYVYTMDYYNYLGSDFNYFLEQISIKFDFLLSFISYFIGIIGVNFDLSRFLYNFLGYLILGTIYLDIVENNKELTSSSRSIFYSLFCFITFSFSTYLWRFGLSTAFFVYGAYLITYKGRHIGWWLIIVAIFNHVSFLIFAIGFILQLLIPFRFPKWLVATMCCSAVFLNSSMLASLLPFLPTEIVDRFGSYLDGYYATEYFADHSILYQIQQFMNESITYVAIIVYLFVYKDKSTKEASLTNSILAISCLSLPFDTMRMRFLAVLLLFLKIYILTRFKHSTKHNRMLLVLFFFAMIGNIMVLWGNRRSIDVSDYIELTYKSTPHLLFHTYTKEWIDVNITEDGNFTNNN